MALVIEDGSQVAGSNSYISVTDAQLLADDFGITLNATDAEKNLKIAYRWLITQERTLQGDRVGTVQTGVYPRYPVEIRGIAIGSDVIPNELKEAQVWAAYAQETASILAPDIESTSGAIKRERLDGVGEQEYFQGRSLTGNDANSALQYALELLYPLTNAALGTAQGGLRVVKNFS